MTNSTPSSIHRVHLPLQAELHCRLDFFCCHVLAYWGLVPNERILLLCSACTGNARRYRTRSYIEGKLIEIMERGWEERTKRADMFQQVVHFLREVKSIVTKC